MQVRLRQATLGAPKGTEPPMPWHVDDTYAPILVLDNYGIPSDAELLAYLDQLRAWHDRPGAAGTHCINIVLSDQVPNARERARMAAAYEGLPSRYEKQILATFVMVPNALARGALTAMSWFMADKLKSVRAVSSYADAFRDAVALAKKEHLPLPINLDELRSRLRRADQKQQNAG